MMRIAHSPKIMMDAFQNFHSLLKYDAHTPKILMQLGNTSQEKNQLLSGIAQITSPPLPHFFWTSKTTFREAINFEKKYFL